MFPLHDRTRRRICLAAFFALCVVPTVIVLTLGVARHLPGHVRAEAERLSWRLGQKVSLGQVRHLRPGVVLYEGVELSDPETGRLILRCRALQTAWKKSRDPSGQRRSSLMLTATQPEIEADELAQVWQMIRRVLTGRAGSSEPHLELTAGRLTLRSGENAQTLTDLHGRIETLATGTQADVAFRVDGLDTPERVQIRIRRSHESEPPTTGWGLYTGGGALPCSLLALGLPDFEAAGPQSQFCGYFWIDQTPDGSAGEVIGQFTALDLDAAAGDRFPHTLRGTAQLTVQPARFRAGRLVEAVGSLVAGPGVISGSLLSAAADRLGMAPRVESDVPGRLVSYDRLGVSFRIGPEGLQLRGQCAPAGSGAILVDRYGPLLSEPVSQPLPVASLVQTFSPGAAVQVPATRQTGWLLRRLPMPGTVAPRVAEAASSHVVAPSPR